MSIQIPQLDINRLFIYSTKVVKDYIVSLLNIIETLYKELNQAYLKINCLEKEIARLKGVCPKPNIKPNVDSDNSSKDKNNDQEKDDSNKQDNNSDNARDTSTSSTPPPLEDRTQLPAIPLPKTEDLPIVETIDLTIENKEQLPPDAVKNGHRQLSIPTIELKVGRIVLNIERYYSPSLNETYEAEIPEQFKGYKHSPQARALIFELYYGLGVTENKILKFLHDKGFPISEGKISEILTEGVDIELFHTEKDEMFAAAVTHSTYLQIDDSGARVNGINHYNTVLCNLVCSFYFIRLRKNRLTVIEILFGNNEIHFLFDKNAIDYLETKQLPNKYRQVVSDNFSDQLFSRPQIDNELTQLLPKLPVKYNNLILEAAAISYYYTLPKEKQIEKLISDDDKQFQGITEKHGLCWIHGERLFKKLTPCLNYNQKLVDNTRNDIWNFYQKLKQYKDDPKNEHKQLLVAEFDAIFSTKSDYDDLTKRKELTLANKDKLLLVLEQPEIPLHNNIAELAERLFVIKRKISTQTRSNNGTRAWETMLSFYDTCRKLGVSYSKFLYDRISRNNKMSPLAQLIEEKLVKPPP
jgi:hypothetical protein